MKSFILFLLNFFKALIIKHRRYVRISPFTKGKIYFFDKIKNDFFSILVRGRVDSMTADQIFTENSYDLLFLKKYDDILNKYNSILSYDKVPLIIDCGANIGLSTIHFSKIFPSSKVISLEPEKNNFSLMEINCASLNNVELLNKAVGSFDGYVNIVNIETESNSFRVSRNDINKGDIQVISINNILSSHSEFVPFIIKIDIEGFEEDLFSKNTEWVDKFKLLIIETHDWMLPNESNSHNFLKVISDKRRDFIHRGENIYSISIN